jgi:hypothetical protein
MPEKTASLFNLYMLKLALLVVTKLISTDDFKNTLYEKLFLLDAI